MAWAPDYVTLAELKSYLNDISDTADDPELALAITAASRAVDVDTSRQFGSVAAEQRFYTARYDRRRWRWIVEIDDVMTTSGFVAKVQDQDGVDVGTIDQFVLEPKNAAQVGRPWTQLMVRPKSAFRPTGLIDEVAVTAAWGWTAIPTAVKQATLLQASRVFARRQSPYGIAGSPDVGSELRLLARVDPDVSVSLRAYRRWWAGA